MRFFLFAMYFLSCFLIFSIILAKWGNNLLKGVENKSKDIQKKLEKEFIKISSRRILFFFTLILTMTAIICVATKKGTLLFLFPLIFIITLHLALKVYAHQRRKKVLNQIPFFLDMTDSYGKAGISFPQTLLELTEKVKSPLKEEIKIITGNLNIGLPLEEALKSLYERTPAEETLITYLSISSCIANGANIGEMISKIKHSLLEKQRAEKKMRAQTSQGKLQGIILTFIPLFLILALNAILPGYFQKLLSAVAGRMILLISSVLLLIGWVMILRIIKPEV